MSPKETPPFYPEDITKQRLGPGYLLAQYLQLQIEAAIEAQKPSQDEKLDKLAELADITTRHFEERFTTL